MFDEAPTAFQSKGSGLGDKPSKRFGILVEWLAGIGKWQRDSALACEPAVDLHGDEGGRWLIVFRFNRDRERGEAIRISKDANPGRTMEDRRLWEASDLGVPVGPIEWIKNC